MLVTLTHDAARVTPQVSQCGRCGRCGNCGADVGGQTKPGRLGTANEQGGLEWQANPSQPISCDLRAISALAPAHRAGIEATGGLWVLSRPPTGPHGSQTDSRN